MESNLNQRPFPGRPSAHTAGALTQLSKCLPHVNCGGFGHRIPGALAGCRPMPVHGRCVASHESGTLATH